LRVATVLADVFVKAGLLDRLAQCYADVSTQAEKPSSKEKGDTFTEVLTCIEACASSAIMFAWLGVLAGAPPCEPLDEQQTEQAMKEAADGFLAFLKVAGKPERARLVRELDARCDLAGRLSALSKQYSRFFPKQQVDSILSMLGGKGQNTAEAFPALPPAPIDQLLSLFPEADMTKLQKALSDNHGNVELVVTKICEKEIDVEPSLKEAPVLTAPIEDGQHLVIYKKGEHEDMEEGDGDSEEASEEAEKMRDTILARLAKMEEEEEREQIRRYEAQRLRKSTAGSDEYNDEYDDSFDDFVKYNFQDGEALDDTKDVSEDMVARTSSPVARNSSPTVHMSAGPAVAAAAAADSVAATRLRDEEDEEDEEEKEQGTRLHISRPSDSSLGRGGNGSKGRGGANRGGGNGNGRRGGGNSGNRGRYSGRGKKHHQGDRAMNKRNRGMLPIINA